MQLFDHIPDQNVVNWQIYERVVAIWPVVARKFSEVRTEFWGMKILWRRDRHYVATPNMEVWQRLECLAPDAPDEWSFPDVCFQISSSLCT